jgi:integration host factor subunit alpha
MIREAEVHLSQGRQRRSSVPGSGDNGADLLPLEENCVEGCITLTKANVAEGIGDDCGFMKGEATEVFEKLLDIINKSLIAGEEVLISGFGRWSVTSNHARRGTSGRPLRSCFFSCW